MSRSPTPDSPWLDDEAGTVLVDDSVGTRPFMPGWMVHSLVGRGYPFVVAWQVAREVAERLEGRDRITRTALAELLDSALQGFPIPDTHVHTPNIIIEGRGDGIPFSKGVLSRSLMATAIEPSAAYAAAREIEEHLISSGASEVSRNDLAQLAHDVLRSRAGGETASRYLLWRKYQEPEQPVILLLGGTSGVGKTSLALEVARRLGIARVLATDSIRQVLRIMLSADFAPAIHGSSYDAYKLLPDVGGARPTVLDGFKAQATTVSIGVKASVDRTISESANLVIDGVSLEPGMIDPASYAGRAHVVPLLVATRDEKTLRNRFEARATNQKKRLAERYLKNLDGILQIQRHLIEMAEFHQVPIVDNESFDVSVRIIIDHVMNALRSDREARP
jgi:2-phosphoglycerate kinase